jgi:Cof subfamily protein (haloacid dehalogenase superfamily)
LPKVHAVIRLIGIDVDGTLIGSNGEVDSVIWRAAVSARAAGIRLVLCSGRPAFGVALAYAKRLDHDGWHSFQNGASTINLADQRSLSISLPDELVQTVIARARATGRLLELYSDTDYVSESKSAWAHAHAALLGIDFKPRPFESLRGPIVRAQWLVSQEETARIVAETPPGVEVAQSTSPLMPDTRFIGITNAGVSKGSAIRTIAADYGIPLQQVMYVGDAGNDLAAMRIVGFPVAMRNASAEVRQAARQIVGDVDNAGLVEALELAMTASSAPAGMSS